MDRHEWAKKLKQQQRDDMRNQIKEAILYMRANKITITKTSLAEEIGVSRQALNSEYVKEYLCNFAEFNPDSQVVISSQEFDSLKNENSALKAEKKDLKQTIKQLKNELASTKRQLKESSEKYELLLGRYQADVGNKIIHF